MPDVTAMYSESHPVPACRHAGHPSHDFRISSGAGMPAVSADMPIGRSAGRQAGRRVLLHLGGRQAGRQVGRPAARQEGGPAGRQVGRQPDVTALCS